MDIVSLTKRAALGILLLSMFAFIIFLLLVIINYTVAPIPIISWFSTPVSTGSQVSITTPTIVNQTLYSKTVCPNDTILDFDTMPELLFSNFTLSFDCYINGQYKSTDVPRVLFYFGSSPVNITKNNDLKEYKTEYTNNKDSVPFIMDNTETDILNVFTNTNFIIYLDPVKNDLRVGVITKDSANKEYLELLSPIENVPINQTFQITMILTDTFVELYKDKKLVQTYKIRSNLDKSRISATSSIVSPIQFIGNTVQVANIQYFNAPISSSQVRTLTNTPLQSLLFNT